MKVLQNMSLIKINEDNEVWMHDQLRELGREIVLEECDMQMKKQTRVWDPKKGLDLLRRHKGNKEVEALRLNFDHRPKYRFNYEGFESLSNLRFLGVGGSKGNFLAEPKLLWHESPSNAPPTNENSDLLLQLRWLSWVDIPLTFNIKNFSMEDVVILDLSGSEITGDWEGWSHMKVMENLKVMDLSNCQRLKRTPEFSAISNLERLILRGCSELVEIHGSISHLKSLVSLDVRECMSLERLPKALGELKDLKELRIDVTRIQEIPNIGGMRNLRIFTASYCRGLALPPTIGDLASLEYLCLTECSSLERLPDTIGNLESLIKLDIYPSNIRELPDSIGRLKNLKVVKMMSDSTSKIPDSFWEIEKLEEIQVTHPGGSESALAEIDNCLDRRTMEIVKIALSSDIEVGEGFRVKIGSPIYRNQSLRILRLSGAKIEALPKLPESLVALELDKLHMKTFPGLSNLTNLKELRLRFGPCDDDGGSAAPVEEDPGLGNLRKLESLSLTSDYVTTLPTGISLLPRLRKLEIRCRNLHCLPSLPSSLLSLFLESECLTTLPTDISSLLPRLQTLDLKCPDLRRLPSLPSSLLSLSLTPHKSFCSLDLSNSKKLSNLRVADCAISEIRGLDHLQNLQDLHLKELKQVKMLPALSNFNKLSSLTVHDCRNLVEIQGELPPSLATLEISGCRSLRTLPDLSSLMGLLLVEIKRCRSLNVEAISSLCSKKDVTFLGDEDDELGFPFEYESEGEDDEGFGDMNREAIQAYFNDLFASFGLQN
ncbi:disease resistance protein RPV1-like [Rhodamnia argentea]|uniref:Disease resistance protein RPV1-like n=1 Tax=Rhodamnia argentea TaxID=178133 RepID=A0ABM3GXY7_9MYRT|nr:disease resistance protein RPV1-like [Rhodamnia argentea]